MEYIGFFYILGMFLVFFELAFGGYMLQKDRYWVRVWEDIGRPDVSTIEELKSYIDNQYRQY